MKTSEMIAMLEENPRLKFKCSESKIFLTRMNNFLIWVHKDGREESATMIFDRDWQLVRDPVTWQEAIQAWIDGKTIKCDYPPNDMKLISTTFFLHDSTLNPKREALITGTWYIED